MTRPDKNWLDTCRRNAMSNVRRVRNRTDAAYEAVRMVGEWFDLSRDQMTGEGGGEKEEFARVVAVRMMDFAQCSQKLVARMMNRRRTSKMVWWRARADIERDDPWVQLASQVGEEMGATVDRARKDQQLAAYYARINAEPVERAGHKVARVELQKAQSPSELAMSDLAMAMRAEIAAGHRRSSR